MLLGRKAKTKVKGTVFCVSCGTKPLFFHAGKKSRIREALALHLYRPSSFIQDIFLFFIFRLHFLLFVALIPPDRTRQTSCSALQSPAISVQLLIGSVRISLPEESPAMPAVPGVNFCSLTCRWASGSKVRQVQ